MSFCVADEFVSTFLAVLAYKAFTALLEQINVEQNMDTGLLLASVLFVVMYTISTESLGFALRNDINFIGGPIGKMSLLAFTVAGCA